MPLSNLGLKLSSSDGVDSCDFRDVERSVEFGRIPIDANAVPGRRNRSVKVSLSGPHVLHFLIELVAQDVVGLPSILGRLEASSYESVSGVHPVVFSHHRSRSTASCCVRPDLNLVEVHQSSEFYRIFIIIIKFINSSG